MAFEGYEQAQLLPESGAPEVSQEAVQPEVVDAPDAMDSFPLPSDLELTNVDPLPEGLFRLLNIHLVDSLCRGRIQTMGIDGGAALTGRNGQGKTSLLSLPLMFYGVEPRDVVSQGKDSFIDYYLPNQTSFIAYEYERPDGGRRLVVAHSNTNSTKVMFRFVKSEFRRDMFVYDDGALVLNREFRRRLSELGISCSDRQIDTYQDYRCIIQYWQPYGVDHNHRRYLAGLSADYAFTRYNRSLRHLEKLTKGMFSRKANFDDLQQVVADWVFEGKPSVGIHTERRKVETWPRDYSAYKNIMAIEPMVKGAQDVRAEMDGVVEAIVEIKEKLLLLQTYLMQSEGQEQQNQEQLRTQRNEKSQQFESLAERLTGEISTVRHQIELRESDLATIERQREKFKHEDVETKRVKAAGRQLLVSELSTTSAQLEALQGAFGAIKSKYQTLIVQESEQFVTFRDHALNEKQKHISAERDELAAIELSLKQERQDRQSQARPARSLLQAQHDELQELSGQKRSQMENPSPDPELVYAIEQKETERTRASQHLLDTILPVSAAEQSLAREQEKSRNAEQALGAAESAVKQQERLLEEMVQSGTPEPDSLLHFLRSNHPGWVDDIAKVVNPLLLHRNDLAPRVTELADSLYGISLDLEYVDPVEEADEEKLQQVLAEAHDLLVSLKRDRVTALDRLSQSREEVARLGRESTLARSAHNKAKIRSENSQNELDQLRRQANNKLIEIKALAKTAWEQTLAQLHRAKESLSTFDESLSNALIDLEIAATAKRSATQQRYKLNLDDIDQSVETQSAATKQTIQTLTDTRDAELKGQGADVEIINKLEGREKTLRAHIDDIDSWQPLISDWQRWMDAVEIDEPAHRLELVNQRSVLIRKEAEQETARQVWQTQKQQIDDLITSSQDRIKRIQEQLLIIASSLDSYLVGYSVSTYYIHCDKAWSVAELKGSLLRLMAQLREKKRVMNEAVDKMRSAFQSTLGAPPSDYMQDRLDNLRIEQGQIVDARATLQVVEEWFSTHHDKSRRLLMADAQAIFGDIQDMHRALKTFTDKITRFNTGLQDHLTHSAKVFDSFTDLQVSIFSSVEDLDYWAIITKISKAREEWNKPDQLPSEEAVENLRSLLSNWDLRRGIQADFRSLVSIRGSVREKGNVRPFHNRNDLENISSNGLSYLVLIVLFLGFISKVRGDAPVQLTWCVDELKAIDSENVLSLCNYLGQNRITLCTAFPDPDVETLILFQNKYKLDSERRLVHCELAVTADPDDELELQLEDN